MTKEARGFLNLERVADAGPGAGSPISVEQATPTVPEEVVIPETHPDERDDEFENYRRRVRKEMEEHEVRVREAIMLDFLEIADNLERATAAWKEGAAKSLGAVQDGIASVLRLFQSKLERYAVTPIEAEGKPFDPRVHHAVAQSTSTDTTPGTVLQEVQKGYWMDGRLLRPAAVVVASAPVKAVDGVPPDAEAGLDDDPTAQWHAYQRNRR
jgi:molecular chaperone GrpE (heat shock protein)